MDSVIRVAFIYFFLMLALRLMGKREMSEMSPFELTAEEVFTEIHKAGVEELAQVRWAILEVDGKIAIIPADSERASRNAR